VLKGCLQACPQSKDVNTKEEAGGDGTSCTRYWRAEEETRQMVMEKQESRKCIQSAVPKDIVYKI